MYRKYYKDLLVWKKGKNRKPLIIRGARQVGKTFLVREFARREFDNFIEINLDETPDKAGLFEFNDVDAIIRYLSLDTAVPVVPGKTLIFIDEIQRAPEVFAKLRYFFEKRKDIPVIAAGSLLDFVLADHDFSMPVGRIEYLHMGPMDFHEFLIAGGKIDLSDFLNTFDRDTPLPGAIHKNLAEQLRLYMGLGGMPSVLKEYFESGDLEQCENELASLLSTYRDDFSKYGVRVNSHSLQLTLDRIPGIIGRKVKYSEIDRDAKSEKVKKSLKMLELARVICPVYHSGGNGIPLRAEKKEHDFKLLFLDIGLMMRSLGLNLLDLRDDSLLLINKGALAEQFIGQELLAGQKRHEKPEMHYWNREKSGSSSEVDYLIQSAGKIVPIEVKAGTTGSLKSLHVFSALKKTETAVRFNLDTPSLADVTANIPGIGEHDYKLLSLPLYMAGQVERLLRETRNE